jgi:hypothetical protein
MMEKLSPSARFPNLQTLDLSGNEMRAINTTNMLLLPNLKVLRLADNPITTLYMQENRTGRLPVRVLDLRNTALDTFDSESYRFFPDLKHLQLSHTPMHFIARGGFQRFSQLHELDLRGTQLAEFLFADDVFQGLTRLSVVYSPNYRLCCADWYPSLAIKPRCVTTERTVSSCGDLLRSSPHQVTLMVVCVLAVAGNALCLLVRHVRYKESRESLSFSLLMNSLNMSNLLTGVHGSIVAFKDYRLRSQYIHHEVSWRRSALCKAAGFLSVLSHRASALLMVLITLERLLHARQASVKGFGTRATVACSVLAWCVGWVEALVPLTTSGWEYYGHTALCVPLPATFHHHHHHHNAGGEYQFALDTVLNAVLVCVVCLGQVFIYLSLPQTSLLSVSSVEDDLTRVFFKLAVTDCVRGAVLSCAGLITYMGDVVMEEDVAAGLAIFILPLNAALNPCLHVVERIRADRSRATQRKLLAQLKRQANEQRHFAGQRTDRSLSSLN